MERACFNGRVRAAAQCHSCSDSQSVRQETRRGAVARARAHTPHGSQAGTCGCHRVSL